MTRTEVLKTVILATANACSVEPTSIVVHEVTDDAERLLAPKLGLLMTVERTANARLVRHGSRVVVLHSHDARVLDSQIALLLAQDVGFIVIPNANPAEEAQQQHPRTSSVWTGDGWRAVARARAKSNRYVVTVDEDHGTAVVFPVGHHLGVSAEYSFPDEPGWYDLVQHRAEWLGLVSGARLAELLAGPVAPEVSEPTPSTAVDVQPETVETPADDQPVVEPAPEAVETPTPATSRRSRRRSSTGNA